MTLHSEAVEAGGVTPPAAAIGGARDGVRTVRVWDPFIRIFHWSLVALFIVAFVTGDRVEKVHIAAGYSIAAAVATRILWGFVGSRYARFSSFVRLPGETLDYMRKIVQGRAERHLGHNPAGAAMTVALLAMLIAISVTGYMMTTDAFWGAEWVEELHKALVYATLGQVVAHVGGVILAGYQHRENLVKAMITGRKRAA